MRALRVSCLVVVLLTAGCASAPKPVDSAPQSAISIVDETPEYRFVYEATADVMQIPGVAATLNADAAKQGKGVIDENRTLRADMPNDPRGLIQIERDIHWSRAADAGGLASIRMDYYAYGGGAHPITDFDGRIYDKTTGKELHLPDLLNKPVAQSALPDALCIAIAAEKVARGMPADIIGDPMTCSGTDASVKLDGPVVFAASTEKGKAAALRFLFGPYAIGAYVEGRYVIDVPLTAFAADLKPDYASGFGGMVSHDDPPDPEMSPWDENDPLVPPDKR